MPFNPLVSIIMPAYNAEAYIQESIQSLLLQTYQNWELLVVNDGSTDKTMEIVQQFHDPRIRLFSQSNQGVSAARNYALRQMKGEFICFLDADDIYPSGSIASRLKVFEENPDVDYVEGKVEVYDAKLRKLMWSWVPNTCNSVLHDLIGMSGKCGLAATWMIKKKAGTSYGFKVGLTHGEDLLFYISLAGNGKFSFTTEPILRYRSGNASAMSNLDGLEQGYLTITHALEEELKLPSEMSARFRKKARNIMFRTFLKELRPIRALNSYLRFTPIPRIISERKLIPIPIPS